MTRSTALGPVLIQKCAEYRVTGSFDGVTAAPAIPMDRSLPGYQAPNEEQVFVRDVDDIGLITPDFRGGVQSMSDRYIQFIKIRFAVAPPLGSRISVVDASGLVPTLGTFEMRRYSELQPTDTRFLLRGCVFVPQGATLQITGIGPPPAGQFHSLVLGVRVGTTPVDDAMLSVSCCCLRAGEATTR